MQNLSGRLGLLTDAIVAGRLLGLEAPAVLFVTQRLAALAQAQLQGIGAASWAGLAELHAQGRTDVFNRRLVELTRLVAVLGVAALAPIVAYNRRFFELWMLARMGPQGYGGDAVAAVAAFNALVLAVVSLWNWCFSGTGQVHRVAGASALGAAINLAASVALTRSLGVVGPLLGTTIAYLSIQAWVLPLLLRRTFGTPLGPLLRAVALPLAWGLPYAAALSWLARSHPPRGWPGLAAAMALAALGFLAFAALALLGPDDRALSRARLAALRPPAADAGRGAVSPRAHPPIRLRRVGGPSPAVAARGSAP